MIDCMLIIVAALIICISSTRVTAFISCNSRSRQRQQTQQWTHATNSERELQFNLMNLIQVDDDSSKQNMKLQSLASLLEAAKSTIKYDKLKAAIIEVFIYQKN